MLWIGLFMRLYWVRLHSLRSLGSGFMAAVEPGKCDVEISRNSVVHGLTGRVVQLPLRERLPVVQRLALRLDLAH